MQLPAALRQAIEQELAACNTPQLRAAAERISAAYRDARPAQALLAEADRAAYLAVRLPATFAALTNAMRWTREALATPAVSLLDLGSGPGTALWAAAEVFPELTALTALERDAQFVAIARRLAARAEHAALRSAQWLSADLTAGLPQEKWDVVVCSYALNELAPPQRTALLSAAWASTAAVLLLVEPGTRAGFANVAAARAQLLAAGATLAAPCPHAAACPMQAAADWCHFAARVERTSDHRRLKQGDLGHEDEKFSYVAFTRLPNAARAAARIVRHPQIHAGYTQLALCTPEAALAAKTVTRSQKEDWRRLKRLGWGDRW